MQALWKSRVPQKQSPQMIHSVALCTSAGLSKKRCVRRVTVLSQ